MICITTCSRYVDLPLIQPNKTISPAKNKQTYTNTKALEQNMQANPLYSEFACEIEEKKEKESASVHSLVFQVSALPYEVEAELILNLLLLRMLYSR